MNKSYSEMLYCPSFEERFQYLRLPKTLGALTFGMDRRFNQTFYTSERWLQVRAKVIVRDEACDMALPGLDIFAGIRVHHINPVTMEDLEEGNPIIFSLENLVCTSIRTHNGIHGMGDGKIVQPFVERREGDTAPWRKAF